MQLGGFFFFESLSQLLDGLGYGENAVYANGCLYMGVDGGVMAFDINEETFTWYVCE